MMTANFDHHAMNKFIAAIRQEMTPRGAADEFADTLFIGGRQPSKAQFRELARFALAKNYNLVFPSFNPGRVEAGPIGVHAVVTDGRTEAIVLAGGRLWKRDADTPSVLHFATKGVLVRLDAEQWLTVEGMSAPFSADGYERAHRAVAEAAGGAMAPVACISSIGSMATVFDMSTLTTAMAVAA